ncbi:MAG TPA: hypothetical protein VFZ25_12030, partial [Chloroflexota bacterium]|nr:hypothetical protein [Chloroflexota bacterium]
WLVELLDRIWEQYFTDTPRVNRVRVSYGGAWKSRLGLITMSEDELTSYIQVNALLKHPHIPEIITLVTVAHEMVHYAHGFGSPLPRRYKHPHRGGVVKRELVRRGMAHEFDLYDRWVYDNWYEFYAAWEASLSEDGSSSASGRSAQ